MLLASLKTAVQRLKTIDQIPKEINRYILDVLQTSTVSSFSAFFSQLQINLKRIPSFNLTYDEILTMGDECYQEMKILGQ